MARLTRDAEEREEAIIEMVGESAFDDLKEPPKVGDKVVIARYAGKTLGKYADDLERRIIADTAILVVVEED